MTKNQFRVSVVIATIGNPSILETIKSLEEGELQPDEIIVVVPKLNEGKILPLLKSGIRVISTTFFGQVKQRNHGLHFVKNDLILQLDDDVLLDKSCLKNLVNTYIVFGEKCVVGPQFRYFDGVSAWPIRSFLYQIFSTMFWGSKIGEKRFGTINKIGCGHGVDFSIYRGDYKEVEWLSGGCVLQHKSSKLKELHFPFDGKAYCEDLMQSLLQSKNGLRHISVKNAVCRIKKEALTYENYNLGADFLARRHVLDLMGEGKIRLYIWYALKKIHWCFK